MDFYPNALHIDDEMASYDITFYNAFSETSLGGNTVAIILDAGGIEARQMASIANKLNAPATAFVTGLDDTAVDVRFFSYLEEGKILAFWSRWKVEKVPRL
jgi:predicted PhzF superfamily epimerase YddE/YHI9